MPKRKNQKVDKIEKLKIENRKLVLKNNQKSNYKRSHSQDKVFLSIIKIKLKMK